MSLTRPEITAMVVAALAGRTDLSTVVVDTAIDLCLAEEIAQAHDFSGLVDSESIVVNQFDSLGYVAGTTYEIGDNILEAGVYYRCIAETTGDGVADTSYWLALPTRGDICIPMPSSHYKTHQIVLLNGTNSYPMEVRTKTWCQQYSPNPIEETATKPKFLYEEDGYYYTTVPFDGSYSMNITYTKLPTLAATTTAVVPDIGIDRVLICYAASFALDTADLEVSSDRWYKRFERALARAITADQRKPAVVHRHDATTKTPRPPGDYWNNPFVKENP